MTMGMKTHAIFEHATTQKLISYKLKRQIKIGLNEGRHQPGNGQEKKVRLGGEASSDQGGKSPKGFHLHLLNLGQSKPCKESEKHARPGESAQPSP